MNVKVCGVHIQRNKSTYLERLSVANQSFPLGCEFFYQTQDVDETPYVWIWETWILQTIQFIYLLKIENITKLFIYNRLIPIAHTQQNRVIW